MKKVNISTNKLDKFAGKWVVIDPQKERVIAIGETLRDIGPIVTRTTTDKHTAGTVPFAHKVPRSDEGPYILWTNPR